MPAEVRALLDGRDLAAREGVTFLLITTAADGWPHVAMLSVGEVLAPDERQMRFALWPGTHTTENLTRAERALGMLVGAGSAHYFRLRCRRIPDATVNSVRRALFTAQLEEVLEDAVDYATITSGIEFRLRNRDQVLAAWADSVDVMRAAPQDQA